MTESRDQRFFDELNKTTRADEPETPSGATTGPQPIQPVPAAWPPPSPTPLEGFAVSGDPGGGKHHSDPPGDAADVAPEPGSQLGPSPRPPREAPSEVDAA